MSEIVRDYRPGADDAALADLWRRVFGEPRGGQTVEWLFRPGPAGDAPRTVAECDGRIVAHAGGAPLRFRLDGEEVRGAYSVGAMTDPAFQGRGLFVRIGRALYERLEREGFAFVAGFSNANSHRLMTGPLGRIAIRPFPWAVRLVSPTALAAGLAGRGGARAASLPPRPFAPREEGGVRVEEQTGPEPGSPAGDACDRVWRRAQASLGVGCVRDGRYLAWRYGSRPDAGYRFLAARRGEEAAAFASFRPMAIRGVRAGFLLDFLAAPGDPAAARALLRGVAALARQEGCALLSALLPGTGPSRDALRAAGFLRIPEALHPQLIRFSVRGLGRWAGSRLLADPRAWHLSWADTDVV